MAITRLGVKGTIAVIVLAAGSGSRFGGRKLLAPWREGVLIDGALRAAFAASSSDEVVFGKASPEVLVAVGAESEAVGQAARAFATRIGQADRLRIVMVGDWAQGLSASLKAAVRALGDEARAALVFLADMPLIPHEIAPALAAALDDGHAAAAPEIEGALGHPVLLGRELFDHVLRLEGDRGARQLLDDLGPRLARIQVHDPNILLDIDSPAALALAAQVPTDERI